METIHHAFLQTIADSQAVNGDVPAAVPVPFAGDPFFNNPTSCGDIAWGAAFPLLAQSLHTFYGDVRTASRHWTALRKYADHLVQVARSASCRPFDSRGQRNKTCKPTAIGGLAVCDQFGDWLAPHIGCVHGCPCSGKPQYSTCPVPEEMAGFSYVLLLRAMAEMASVVQPPLPDRRAVSDYYSGLAANATDAFHSTFWNRRLHLYGGDEGAMQTLQLPALAIGGAREPSGILAKLQDDLNGTGYHLRVGAVTSKLLLSTLSQHGLHGSALQVATQTTEPSWGYWMEQNATTCWEAWAGKTDGSTSRNHIFLWCVLACLSLPSLNLIICPAAAEVLVCDAVGGLESGSGPM